MSLNSELCVPIKRSNLTEVVDSCGLNTEITFAVSVIFSRPPPPSCTFPIKWHEAWLRNVHQHHIFNTASHTHADVRGNHSRSTKSVQIIVSWPEGGFTIGKAILFVSATQCALNSRKIKGWKDKNVQRHVKQDNKTCKIYSAGTRSSARKNY